MKKSFQELLPAIIGVSFWLIYIGILYLTTKEPVFLLLLKIFSSVSIISSGLVIVGQEIVDFCRRVNDSLKNQKCNYLDASTAIKCWSVEHPPWM